MTEAPIRVRNLCKSFRVPLDHSTTLKYRLVHPRRTSRYRHLEALKDVSFDVPEGQFLGITGPNGCGKSTLLKILSNIYRADSGTVDVRGRVSPFLELGVGFNPELTARENIYLGGSVIGMTRPELRLRIEEILDFAELSDFADQKIKNFSSGMQVRLAFAVAIQANAEILLMDEVLAVGDARFQEKCFAVFAKYRQEGRTVILVTHDLWAIDQHCDRAILLTDGQIIHEGLPTDVTTAYRRLVGASFAAEGGADVPQERWGAREVEILDVRLLDGSGNSSQSFVPEDPLTISVRYRINEPVDEIACSFSIRTDDGLEAVVENSRAARYGIPGAPAGTEGTVAFHASDLPLVGGHYRLAIALQDGNLTHEYDHIENAVAFELVDDVVRSGRVRLDGKWSDTTVERRKAG